MKSKFAVFTFILSLVPAIYFFYDLIFRPDLVFPYRNYFLWAVFYVSPAIGLVSSLLALIAVYRINHNLELDGKRFAVSAVFIGLGALILPWAFAAFGLYG